MNKILQITLFLIMFLFEVNGFCAGNDSSQNDKPLLTLDQIQKDWLLQQDRRLASFTNTNSDPRPNLADASLAVQRGLLLAEDLQHKGINTDSVMNELESIQQAIHNFPANKSNTDAQSLLFQARLCVRELALQNPLLDFDSILFVKRKPGMLPHLSDQYYGWWSRPGGGIFILKNFKSENAKLECLTPEWGKGNFLRPDLSYDGQKILFSSKNPFLFQKILFSYCKHFPEVEKMEKVDKQKLPADAFYHIFEMNADGSDVKQLTFGRYDDVDARYLPNGDIVFLSTRKGQFLQCIPENTQLTLNQTLPDSYVRCGGDNTRPCAVYTLHRMKRDGSDMRPISSFETFEYNPSIANDGRILYTRWDYIDRFNGHFFSLWSARQDGANPQLVYGNYTIRPQAVMEARSIPDSDKIIFTASAHHSHTGGSLVLLDPSKGNEGDKPLVRLTSEVPFPETETNPDMYYSNPYPLSENYYLTSWSHQKLAPHWGSRPVKEPYNPVNASGIYLYDSFGNLELLYQDSDISCMYPIPIRSRKKPSLHPTETVESNDGSGCFLVMDIYQGLEGIERGCVKRIRITGVPPKTQPHMNQPSIGVSREDPGKFVLGTVPVEPDGSAYFRVPSGVPIFFQALDGNNMAVQTMRSLTYVQSEETLSCIGCHESRNQTYLPTKFPLAAQKDPSNIEPGPPGSWPFDFDILVQPVLDQHCIQCHSPGSDNPRAKKFDLTQAHSYTNLLSFAGNDLANRAFEKDRSKVGESPSRDSRLTKTLIAGSHHQNLILGTGDWNRIITWMDVYAQRKGSFNDEQEKSLRELREKIAGMLSE